MESLLKLKSCQFCLEDRARLAGGLKSYWVRCGKCQAFGPMALSQAEAILAWNTRPGATSRATDQSAFLIKEIKRLESVIETLQRQIRCARMWLDG